MNLQKSTNRTTSNASNIFLPVFLWRSPVDVCVPDRASETGAWFRELAFAVRHGAPESAFGRLDFEFAVFHAYTYLVEVGGVEPPSGTEKNTASTRISGLLISLTAGRRTEFRLFVRLAYTRSKAYGRSLAVVLRINAVNRAGSGLHDMRPVQAAIA